MHMFKYNVHVHVQIYIHACTCSGKIIVQICVPVEFKYFHVSIMCTSCVHIHVCTCSSICT